MKKFKTVKRGSAFCLIFAVLFLYASAAYCDAAGMGSANLTETQTVVQEMTEETKNVPVDDTEMEETEIIESESESEDYAETEYAVPTESEERETEYAVSAEPSVRETEYTASTESESKETEYTELTETTVSESEQAESDCSETESDSEAVTETESETVEEPECETEQSEGLLETDEFWEDCVMMRSGARGRVVNPTIHRDNNMILSYLDFPCYFKYATGHGQDIGSKTLAVYCVYNTREAPEDEAYRPDGDQAFSKEITYCLYNGCRYKGKTAYNEAYSTGNWKKDYYITQMAIHLINYEQGRESSIEKQLNKSADSEVYQLIQKMKKDAYADRTLTNANTNQTSEVTYSVSPSTQNQWIKMADGNWRTAEDYSCQSNKQARVLRTERILNSDVPAGVSISVNDPNDPLSSFYFTATPAAYREIAQKGLTVTAKLCVEAEEYGGWWYEPVKSSVKRQYVTFLALEAAASEEKTQATATADRLEQFASLTIYKEGERLTGAVSTEQGIEFRYSMLGLAGAVFELRAGEVIRDGAGEVVWQKDAVAAKDLTTDASGRVTVSKLPMGTYYLIEKEAPAGMVQNQNPIEVVLTPENDHVEITEVSATVTNKRQKVKVSVVKTDSVTKQPLEGAVFALYAEDAIYAADGSLLVPKGTLIAKAKSASSGEAVFSCDLPVGYSYCLKEQQAPSGYIRDTEQQYSFYIKENKEQEQQEVVYRCTNERVQVSLKLQKRDKETGEAAGQGDASLEGAVYGLYAREQIEHPDGHTGTIYQKDEQIAALKTDEDGQAEIKELYAGKYYLKELTAPEGYVLDETEHDVQFVWENDQTAVLEQTVVLEEQVKKQAFQLIKGSDKGDAEPEALQGAGFTVWLISDLEEAETENEYDTSEAEPIVIGVNGETELFTDAEGYLCTIPLPYGRYLVRETTVPENHRPVKEFLVTISEHSPEQPQPWRILLDECFMAQLKIIKKDCISGKVILTAGAEFQIKNLDTGKYVEQETTYPEMKVHTSYFTNEEGWLILPKALEPGRYQIEEITAPEGYTCSSEPIEISIAADQAFLEDTASGEVVLVQEVYDVPVSAQLTVEKRGNVLVGLDGLFQYEEQALAGVTFELLAEEDIWYPDGSGICFEAGTTAATAVTDQQGRAAFEELPLGTYRIREQQAPFGYLTDQEGMIVVLAYQGQEVSLVKQELNYYNERQQLKITVKKTDQESEAALAGAVFGLYVAEDICNQEGTVIAAEDTCLNQISTDEEGMASFDLNLPHGKYYLREEQAPRGYVTDGERYEIDLSQCDGSTKEIVQLVEVTNKMTECEISKTDITSGEEIPGASLEIRDDQGNLVEKWISEEVPHKIRGLQPGVLYTLTEKQAPYGYIQAETITFQIEDSGVLQQVKMEDTHAKGRIRIKKEDADTKEALSGAVYELRDSNGKILEILTTDKNGEAESNLYEIGNYQDGKFVSGLTYILKETDAPKGYELDQTEYEVQFAYADDKTPEVAWEKVLKNQKLPPAATPKSVQTGDHTDLFGLLCMLFLSGEALLALFFFRKKLK